MEALITYLSEHILALPLFINGPGIFLIAFFMYRAVDRLIRLRILGSIINLFYALIVALILAKYGTELAALILDANNDIKKGVKSYF